MHRDVVAPPYEQGDLEILALILATLNHSSSEGVISPLRPIIALLSPFGLFQDLVGRDHAPSR